MLKDENVGHHATYLLDDNLVGLTGHDLKADGELDNMVDDHVAIILARGGSKRVCRIKTFFLLLVSL